MINLVKNELYKIFHKKGIYIVLLITVLFSLLTNFIYNTDLLKYNTSEDEYEIELYFMKAMEEENEIKNEDYLASKSYVETYRYAKNFGENSWQRVILTNDLEYNSKIMDIHTRIYSYELNLSNDKKDYDQAKKEKEELTVELKSINCDDFIKQRKILTEKNLEAAINANEQELIYVYQTELEVLELREKYDIAYAFDDMNNNLDIYQYNKQIILTYKDKEKLKQQEEDILKESEKELAIAKTKIENNIKEVSTASNHYIFLNFYSEYFIMILVMIILVSGSIVSEEFSKGTIKLLLVKPYSRVKILMSKYLTTILMILFSILSSFLIQTIIGGLFFGYDSLEIPTIIYNYATSSVEQINVLKYFLLTTISVLPQFILIGTISFALSTILTSTSLANTLTLIGVFGSDLINLIAQSFEIDILKYFITLNWDFSVYLFGGTSPYKGVTLPFSIIVCLIYLVLILIITTITFKKRDIKNI